MRDTILLTGATGALGRILLPRLAREGYSVYCLVRAKDRAEANRRIRDIVGQNNRIKAIRGDITEPRCGISDLDREQMMARGIQRIFHCAASISFQDKIATHKANVDGARNVLELADLLDIWQFVHVSTAYAGGDARFFNESQRASSIQFRPRNEYEATKQLGEAMVRAWALAREERRLMIFRPSILIGCADGTSPTFDAYYGYFKPIHRIAEGMRKHKRQGKSLPADVHVQGDWVNIPLVLQASEAATLNLIPIDWNGYTMVQLLGAYPHFDTYHLVNPDPPLVRWVIDTSMAYLKVAGYHVVAAIEEKNALLAKQDALTARLQAQLDRVLDQYYPYTNHVVTFGMQRVQEALGDSYVAPPKLDTAFMERLLSFALESNWGERQRILVPAE
jgi:nucleoside-diphosphate-sugar epimerase